MKLKLVVSSMGILGFISLSVPAFAQDNTNAMDNEQANQTMQTSQTMGAEPAVQQHHKYHKGKHKHHKHKHHKHHMVAVTNKEELVTYKDMPPESVCTISQASLVLDSMTQNLGRALPNPCVPGWFNRIAISGGVNVDLGKFGDRNISYMGENYQIISLNDVYLNVSAHVNDWAKAFASVSFNTATINDPLNSAPTAQLSEYDAAYENNVTSGSSHTLQLEQAYATFANFNVSPVFVQVGKQFADFSRYPLHPITESVTQVMSKTLATAAKVGFIADGFNGSIYAFDDPINKVSKSTSTANYGAALGYEMVDDHLGWDVGIGYLYNMIGVNDIAYNVNQFNLNRAASTAGGYNKRIGGLAIYADVNSGPFYLGARYTEALSRFSVLDLPRYGVADVTAVTIPGTTTTFGTLVPGATGAKPWAYGIQGAYGFNWWCQNPATVYLGYQQSQQASGLNLPKKRALAGFSIDPWSSTNFAIEWDHDIGYGKTSGGNGRVTNLVSLRAGVQFS